MVEAKRQLVGAVAIDLLPGPSEVMVLADDTCLLYTSFAGSDASGTPVGIRTPNLLIRSQTLSPIELRAL